MDEQQIRALVRDAIARHHGSHVATVAAPALDQARTGPISHMRFQIVRPADEVECLIEPAVACNHCGHCLCFGH